MMLAVVLLLPRLLAGAAPSDVVNLSVPRVDYRTNEAGATRTPWIDANGWRMSRAPGQTFLYRVSGETAALAAGEAFTYGADALIATDESGRVSFHRMLDFLRAIPSADLSAVADVGVVDDGSAATGELMNLLTRQNLLYKVEKAPDDNIRLNVQLGSAQYPLQEASNPHLLARRIRAQIGDENRSLRIYGSEVVIARLARNDRQARIYLLNYSNRAVRGLRVRVRGRYAKGEPRVFAVTDPHLEDWSLEGDAIEFTVPQLNTLAVIDLLP
jgi:hypothetical protein